MREYDGINKDAEGEIRTCVFHTVSDDVIFIHVVCGEGGLVDMVESIGYVGRQRVFHLRRDLRVVNVEVVGRRPLKIRARLRRF